MSRSLRIILVVIGALIMICALVTLAYAFWPAGELRIQFPLSPTLFAPP